MLIIFLGNKLCSFIPLIVLRATDLKQDKVLVLYHYTNKTQDYYLLGKKKYLHRFDRIEVHSPEMLQSTRALLLYKYTNKL